MKLSLALSFAILFYCVNGLVAQNTDVKKKDSAAAYRANDRLQTAGPKDGWKQEGSTRIKNVKTDTTRTGGKKIKTERYEITYKGFTFLAIEPYFDSAYYPKSLYFNIRIASISGLGIDEVNKGKSIAKIFSENGQEISLIKEMRQYVAKTKKVGDQVNILVNIPLNPQDGENKKYTAYYLWQDAASDKFIEIHCRVSEK